MRDDDDNAVLAATLGVVAFVVLVMFIVSIAFAQERIVGRYVAPGGHPNITLWDAACTGRAASVVAVLIKTEYHARFKGGTSEFRMRDGATVRTFEACWIRLDPPEAAEPVYLVIYEDGDNTVIPVREFRDHSTRRLKHAHAAS